MNAHSSEEAIQLLRLAGGLGLTEFWAEGAGLAEGTTDAVRWARAAAVSAQQCAELAEAVSPVQESRVSSVRRAIHGFGQNTRPSSFSEAALRVWLMRRAGQRLVQLTHSDASGGADVEAPEELEQARGDEAAGARLGLYGRRVIGEATAQAQRVASHDSDLMAALTGAEPGSSAELASSTQLLAQLVEGCAQDMISLGLQA